MKTSHYLFAIGITGLLVQACDKAEPHDETAQIEQPTEPLLCNDTLPIGSPPKPPIDCGDDPEMVVDCNFLPATYSLVNKTAVPIRIAYGPYDGACLPPQLPTDTQIAPGDSSTVPLEKGVFIGQVGSLFLADQIFPSNNLMVIFNEERFVTHVNTEYRCVEPNSKEGRDRNLFCGYDYVHTHWTTEPRYESFRSYTFTEADRERAQPLPQRP